MFLYEKDKKGLATIYIRVRYVKHVPELMESLKLFFVFQMFKCDEEAMEAGWSLVIDFTGATVSNCDLEMVTFMVNVMDNYFPCGVDYILTYELPWVLNAVWKIIRTCIPENSRNLIKSADRKSIGQYVEAKNLPDFMGTGPTQGKCRRNYKAIPMGCPTAEEYGMRALGLDPVKFAKIMEKFKPKQLM
jgi:hypothetical protein